MKITKTSKQKQQEEERRNKAYLQTLECPECGTQTKLLDRVPLAIAGTRWKTYVCECRNCGCEWETDKW